MPRSAPTSPPSTTSTAPDPDVPAPAGGGHRAGFWLVGALLATFLAASSAPSPLYAVLQREWHFTPLTLTTVFASYAVALLVALLTVGGISDFVGRRPVLLGAVALEVVSMLLFLHAHDVGLLLVARVVQGLATGTVMGAGSAALVDLQSPRSQLGSVVNGAAATGGLAVGALLSGALLETTSSAATIAFVVLLVAFAVLAVLLWFLPETIARRPGALASLRPRLAVPAAARSTFLAVTPVLIATWSLAALYLSLGPSIAAGTLGLGDHLLDATVVALFTGSGAVAGVLARHVIPALEMLAGSTTLALGTAITVLGVATAGSVWFLVGTAVAGVGFGTAFLGGFRSLVTLALPQQRAELLAAVFVASYLAFSAPAIIAGLVLPSLGLRTTAIGYGVIVGALAATVPLGVGRRRLVARRAARRG